MRYLYTISANEPEGRQKIDTMLAEHQLWLQDPNMGKRADFSEKIIIAADLSGRDLRGALFRNSHLIGVDLSGCNLGCAHDNPEDFTSFKGAILEDVNWRLSNLRGMRCRFVTLNKVDAVQADLSETTHWSGASIKGMKTTAAKMCGTSFAGAQADNPEEMMTKERALSGVVFPAHMKPSSTQAFLG